jgi:putative ABC transport system permease protein
VTRSGERTVRLSGVAAPEHSDTLVEQAAVFVTDAEAATVSGPTAFAVTAAPGTSTDDLADRIRDTLGTETVHTGPAKVNADLPGALPDYIGAISIFGFVIGITTFATIFVLTGTVSLAIRQRLRELALLRATGATPRQLWQLLRSEVLVVTLAATVVGAPLGMVAAGLIAARFRDLGAVPAQFDVRVNVGVLLAAGLVTVIVARCSARLASRQAIRVTPALRETVVETRGGLLPRVFIALVCAVGAATILGVVPLDGPFGMGMTFISSALLLCALGAAGPLVVRMLGEIGARLSGTTGITGWLAGAFTRAENRRVTAVAVPLALMFAINAPMLLNGSLTADLAQEQERLRTAPATAIATGALPLDDVGRMADLVDMAATIPTRLIVDEGGKPEDYQANGLLMAGDDAPLDLGYVAGGWREDGLSVSSYLARARGWHVGQEVSLWLPDGTQSRLRLTGVYDRSRGFGDLVAPARLVAEHDPKGLVTTVRLRGDVATVSERFPTLRVDPVATAARAGDADKQQGAWEIMIVISLGFTAIAVINTFAIAASARRNQFAQLRLIGATRRQVRQMASRETLLAVAVGLALGITVTSLVVAAFSLAQDGTLRLVVDPIAYGALSGLVALLGLAAGIIPARMVIRTVR